MRFLMAHLLSDYFSILDKTTDKASTKRLPFTRALSGVIKGSSITEKDYKAHLEKKYR